MTWRVGRTELVADLVRELDRAFTGDLVRELGRALADDRELAAVVLVAGAALVRVRVR